MRRGRLYGILRNGLRVVAGVGEGAGLDQAVLDADGTLGVAGHTGVVRDQHDGDAVLGGQRLEQFEHFAAGARVEVAGRLVGEEQRRAVDEAASDGHALLLAAGQLRRVVVHAVAQADALQQGLGPLAGLAAGQVRRGVGQRHHDVVEGAGPAEQVEALKDEADLFVADHGPLVGRQIRHLLVVEPVLAAGRPVEAAEDVHQRRFARAGLAHQRHHLAARDRDRHALEHGHVQLAEVIRFGDVFKPNQIHASLLLGVHIVLIPNCSYHYLI